MIRIMHILSLLSFVTAGLVLGLYVTETLRGDSSGDPVTGPGAVERLRQSHAGKGTESDCLPPLLQEAQALALYLNPPRTTSATVTAPKSETAAPLPVKTISNVTPASAPKFELHGISYYRQKPDQSMALVLEPDGTRRWVHPGEQLGHLTVERIDCNSVRCRDGAQTHVVALAASDAITKYARSMKDSKTASAPQQAQKGEPGPEVPPPAPGIRQMPLSRVTALLGQPS
jgi:hypothetical protein